MKPEVHIINLRDHLPYRPYDFRVDRESPVGNPAPLRNEKDRDDVCDEYVDHFNNVILRNPVAQRYLVEMRDALHKHGKVRLFCWCYPKRCHGETIKKWLIREVKYL